MEDKINNIHDKFVRESFADVDRAISFFEKMLPSDLIDQIDMKTLKDAKESYIDKELSEYFSDLVFEVSLIGKTEVKTDIVMLFEHKSVPDKNVLVQVGYYMFAHYFKCVRQHKKMKVIIPLIYYQGQRKWKVPQLWDLFLGYPDIIKQYLPTLQHIFIALHSIPEADLLSVKNTLMASALVAQKWRFNPVKLADDLMKILSIFEDKEYDWNFFHMTFVYMISVSEIETDEIKKIINSIPPKLKESVMTTYAKLKEEGRQEGELKNRIQIVLNSFENDLSVSLIANITKLTENEVQSILKEHGKYRKASE
jgi:predicted transposase/invertase (TIGR01784 family)